MFEKKVKEKSRLMEEGWQKATSSFIGGKELKQTTRSGIEIKPVYSPTDIDHLDYEQIGMPGFFPNTRGNYPVHYQVMPLGINQGYGMDTADETRRRRAWLEKLGSRFSGPGGEDLTVYILPLDPPTQTGFDPDDPVAKGRVGACGVSMSTINDFDTLYAGLPLEKVLTTLIATANTLPITALYAAYALDVRNEPLEKLFMAGCNYHYHQWAWDVISFPPEPAMKLQVEYIKWIIENCPISQHSQIEGYNVAEAGATPVQEVAFNFAAQIAIIKECVKAGLDPDDVASQYMVHTHLSLNFFEEIAKIRASRRLWAKLMKEKCGCKRPESYIYRILVAQTAGVELTAQEPHNNIIRTTIMALAGMLAGIEGAWISSYDEALGIPTEDAVQRCVRTYQILSEETDIPNVTDPLGGSYYIEWLTSKMEAEIEKLLNKIEEMGGFVKCWQSGWIRAQVEKSAREKLKDLESGKSVKVGVNKYRIEDAPEYEPIKHSPEAEERAIERVKRYKEERDNEKTAKALEEVRRAAESIEKEWPSSCGVLMPALVEAARARATSGEMHRVLREVFGYGYFSG